METQPYLERQEHEEVLEEQDEYVDEKKLEEEDEDVENIQENVDMPQPSLNTSAGVRNPLIRYDDYVSSVALVSIDGEPNCF